MARPRVSKEFKRYIRETRKVCEYCGHDKGLQIHHTRWPLSKYPQDANDPERVLLLCRRCHRMEHR